MTDPKLDPMLLDLVEHPEAAPPSVAVIVALDTGPREREFASLEAAGLHRRSAVGDVVTGLIAVEDLPRLAAVPCVVAVQGGGALAPEPAEPARDEPLRTDDDIRGPQDASDGTAPDDPGSWGG